MIGRLVECRMGRGGEEDGTGVQSVGEEMIGESVGEDMR